MWSFWKGHFQKKYLNCVHFGLRLDQPKYKFNHVTFGFMPIDSIPRKCMDKHRAAFSIFHTYWFTCNAFLLARFEWIQAENLIRHKNQLASFEFGENQHKNQRSQWNSYSKHVRVNYGRVKRLNACLRVYATMSQSQIEINTRNYSIT